MPVQPASLANLRPISADPARASAQARKTGFGTGSHKLCNATTRTGKPCGKVAAYGTPKCQHHGARRLAGKPSPHRETRDALLMLNRNPPPPELQRAPAWVATLTRRMGQRVPMQAALVEAWVAAQNGNPDAWRNLTKT